MLKRKLCILSAIAMATFFALSAHATVEITDNRNPDATFSEEDFETNSYYYEGPYSKMGFVTVKNNSGADVKATINAIAYGASGETLGTDESTIDVVGPDETAIAGINFYGIEESIDHFDYEVSYERCKYYESILSSIKADAAINGSNVVLMVTNEGDKVAQYLNAYVLFMDANNNIVDYANNYITDDNGELKPGDTISAQFNCGGEFDHIECYFDGRSDGTAGSAVQSDISDEDFDIKEYVVDSGFGSIQYLLVITNNSDKDVEISGNATALNSSGNVVGADDVDLDILGPGETSIGYFYFSNIGNDFDHIDYKLSYKTDSYYAPVISDLSAQASINESNVVVTVTNKW